MSLGEKNTRTGNYDKEYYYFRYESKPPGVEPYFSEIFRNLLNKIPTKDGEITALDVGCGIGRNVAFLRAQGIDAIGIDSAEYAAKTAKQVRASGIQIPIRSDSVDLVVAIHFVEHLAPDNLVRFFSECTRILKHDGVLFVVTPNAISPMRFFLRKRFFFDPSHVVFWNPVALRRLLDDAGFGRYTLRFRVRFVVRRNNLLRDLTLFVFTTSPLSYLRNVLHVAARKRA